MDFTLGEDRQALVDTLTRFLRDRRGLEARRAAAGAAPWHDRETWAGLAELGAIGALFPEEAGGFGGDPFDVTAVFETLGAALAAEPMLPALMAGTVFALAAPDRLEGLIAGGRLTTVAFHEPHARYDVSDVRATAVRTAEGWRLDGAKAVALHAEAADDVIVSAREADGDIALFLVPAASIDMRGYATHDGRRAAELTLSGVAVPPQARLCGSGPMQAAVAVGALALCAEALGVMERLKADTLDYLRTRKQFGAPIGRNQALQHRMAELLVEMEQARSSVINAAAAMGADAATRDRALSAAKFTIGEAATRTAEEAVQMHGGIGMTQELDVSHYAKRAMMIDHQLGDADFHLGRYIALSAA
ncbi:MAG: acyl-CoA dehydrogenase family protein [Pseudomonadota bacterium]|nr:acyl-CoA dehydrogenase family protein [Pseudomonadota bacterium]MEE3098954.1 acyl-CoA dehydrogenase family protein [Pseudomonadota bacterium]